MVEQQRHVELVAFKDCNKECLTALTYVAAKVDLWYTEHTSRLTVEDDSSYHI